MSGYLYTGYRDDNLTEQMQYVISSVNRYGICVLPQYFDHAFCETACDTIDSLMAGGNCTLWQDALKADSRIMGIEALAPELNIYSEPLIYNTINQLYGAVELAGFVMAGKIVALPGNLGSGQGWHRDSVRENQYKALVYLTDVDQQHGPFEYYLNTYSERTIAATERLFGIGKSQNRLSEQDVALLPVKKRITLCQSAGTLVIANTRAIHRGAPIRSGQRYALTTYSWLKEIPAHMQKFVNVKTDQQVRL